ncbi:hypothetical protein [Saccharopolyspora tripterygii]
MGLLSGALLVRITASTLLLRALVRMVTHRLPGPALGATGGNLTTRMTYLLHPATAAHIGPSAMVLSPAVALAIALGPTALLTLACQLSWAP